MTALSGPFLCLHLSFLTTLAYPSICLYLGSRDNSVSSSTCLNLGSYDYSVRSIHMFGSEIPWQFCQIPPQVWTWDPVTILSDPVTGLYLRSCDNSVRSRHMIRPRSCDNSFRALCMSGTRIPWKLYQISPYVWFRDPSICLDLGSLHTDFPKGIPPAPNFWAAAVWTLLKSYRYK